MYLIIILIASFILLSSGDTSFFKPVSKSKPILRERTVPKSTSEIRNFIKKYTTGPDDGFAKTYAEERWNNLYKDLKKINTSKNESVDIPVSLNTEMREFDDYIFKMKNRVVERFGLAA